MKFYKFGNKATSSVSSSASEHVQSAHIFFKVRDESMKLDKCAHFVLDECDQCLEKLDMRGDIQKIFLQTPKKKQVMMSDRAYHGSCRPCEVFLRMNFRLEIF